MVCKHHTNYHKAQTFPLNFKIYSHFYYIGDFYYFIIVKESRLLILETINSAVNGGHAVSSMGFTG